MGGGMEADLTHGAVASIGGGSGGRDGGGPDPRRCGGDVAAGGRLRPVLQVVGAPTARGHGVVRYPRPALRRRALQQAMLPTSLNGLVTTGRLRDGSVVRVLESVYCRRINGKTVDTISSSLLKVNLDLPDAERLVQWYITEGEFAVCTSLSQEILIMNKTIAQIEEEALGRSDKPDWITVEEIIQRACSQLYLFKLKIKEEVYGDEARVKVSIAKAERLGVTLKKSSVPRASHILSDDGLGPRRVVSVRNCPAVMDMQGLHR
ncbi:hypothetical protein ACQ4PT_058666 [Festuca glaucescens]